MVNIKNMGFKENLKDELTYKGIQTKELAAKTGISLNTLNHYLVQNGTSPSAENAVKIANALNVSVEFLVTGSNLSNHKNPQSDYNQLYHKYLKMLKEYDSLPEHEKSAIAKMISELKV